MVDENQIPVATPLSPVTPPPLFRAGTACDNLLKVIMGLAGDFNHKDIVNAYKDFLTKNNLPMGNPDRNARYVAATLLRLGKITKVRRGRWVNVQ